MAREARIVGRMEQPGACNFCRGPIGDGEAWMANEMTGGVAHAGCVYRDERQPERRERWLPSEIAEISQRRAPRGAPRTWGRASRT